MKNRSKMILGLASLLGVTAGATAVSGFAWFVTTKTAAIDVTNIGIYNNNPSLSIQLANPHGVKLTNDAQNDFDLEAAKDSTSISETFDGDGTATEFTVAGSPLDTPTIYVDDVVSTTASYDKNTKKITFTSAPDDGAKIKAVYYDNAALTDVSSIDGINVYNPTWQTAYEGRRATKIPAATAGEHYISFDLQFAPASTGSLKVFLDRPNISAKASDDAAQLLRNQAAASVARVAFSVGEENKLTLSQNVGDKYKQGIKASKVTSYPGDPDYSTGAENDPEKNKNAFTTAGDYAVKATLDNCENLYAPINTNYSVLSSAPEALPENMYITTVSSAPVTVHVAIWLEGTSNTDDVGNFSTPIGGEINVKLPIVAFGA